MSAPAPMTGGRRFRPALWPTLAGLVALCILVALGTWQLERLHWKTALLARIQDRMAQAPAPLPATLDDADAWDYRPVIVIGRFLHDRELHLGPRAVGGQVGLHVLTPLERADGAGVVLVDRGFVPADRRDPGSRAEGQLAGQVTVAGVARAPSPRGWMQPDNDPGANFWYWADLPAMAAAKGLDRVAPVVVQADATPNPGGLPLGGQTVVNIPNNHLSYVVTWYGLAATLVGVWIAFSFRPR